jgi:hypothetical protein
MRAAALRTRPCSPCVADVLPVSQFHYVRLLWRAKLTARGLRRADDQMPKGGPGGRSSRCATRAMLHIVTKLPQNAIL